MPIYSGSRYQNSLVDYFSKIEYGTATPIVFYTPNPLTNVSFFMHRYTKGESLIALSQKFFKRPDLWWTIVEYNPEIADFMSIPDGTEIRIPSV
jgi:hypothetical protein